MIEKVEKVEKVERPKRTEQTKKLSHVFMDAAGKTIELGKIEKVYRDLLKYCNGVVVSKDEKSTFTPLELNKAVLGLEPSPTNPVCIACDLFNHDCNNPFLPYHGNPNPLVTLVFDSVSGHEDTAGYMSSEGPAKLLKTLIDAFASETGVTSEDCRFVALTRCAHRNKQLLALKGKTTKCRLFAVQDLRDHPPKMIMPVGSLALGMLCYKSNAQDWGGRILTYRGWPDDWLTKPAYAKPRSVKVDQAAQWITGHPIMGPVPGKDAHCLLYPIQAPRLVFAECNAVVRHAWEKQIKMGLKLARQGVPPLNYNLPHYTLLSTKEDVITALQHIIDHPGMIVCFDTETTGLHPFHGDRIVFMMFRFIDPESNEPMAFGFPWDYAATEQSSESPLRSCLSELKPYVERALCVSILAGHHLTFDILFTFCALTGYDNMAALDAEGNLRESWRTAMRQLNALADAARYDTWHMAYCRRQARGSLGLERLAYEYVPELAGYEEAMTLLIELELELLHPNEGGHYAQCPVAMWESHFKPYVMGDVEVCARAREAIQAKLDTSKVYRIPIAHRTKRGFFRHFEPPNRAWLYQKIMSPAASVLIKMMGRGMRIDEKALTRLEDEMPTGISATIEKMKNVGTGQVLTYIKTQVATDPEWELDLEKKDHLRSVLFTTLNLPVQRLTKAGRKLYGENSEEWDARIRAELILDKPERKDENLDQDVLAKKLKYAAMDKFTLNRLSVDHEEVRPLQDYRRIYKLYTTYVRPLRNVFNEGLDKKKRTKVQHLCSASLLHAWFKLTGTRSGRLASSEPNLQQIPKRGYGEFNIKEMYVSRFGDRGCLYGSDFSQVELRILAALSGDSSMVDAYHKGIDLHTLTTSRVFGMPYETFSKDHLHWLQEHNKDKEAKELSLKRDIGKVLNFLTGYGGGAFGFQTVLANQQLYWPLEECERLIRLFFDSYPSVRDLLSYYKKFIQEHSVAVSIFGRVRIFDEAQSEDSEVASKAMRAGCNHLIQSTASDMMLICLVIIEQLMRDEGLESILTSTVHDSLIIDGLRSELPQIHEIVSTVLNNMPEFFKQYLGQDYNTSWMLVPFECSCEVGHNYSAMMDVGSSPDWDKLLDDKGSK